MMSYEILSHTADVRILARGSTQAELFRAALEGLCSVVRQESGFEGGTVVKSVIRVESVDMTALLIDFLSDVLTVMHSTKCLINSVDFREIDPLRLEAELSGFSIDEFDMDVKAVTYHEAAITVKNGILETLVILDI